MSLYESTYSFPGIPLSVLEALEEAYPKKDFGPTASLRQLDHHYGQRSVIVFLRQLYEEQNRNILNNTNIR